MALKKGSSCKQIQMPEYINNILKHCLWTVTSYSITVCLQDFYSTMNGHNNSLICHWAITSQQEMIDIEMINSREPVSGPILCLEWYHWVVYKLKGMKRCLLFLTVDPGSMCRTLSVPLGWDHRPCTPPFLITKQNIVSMAQLHAKYQQRHFNYVQTLYSAGLHI